LVLKVAGLLIGTLFALIVSRTLGAAAWGEFSLSLSIITVGAIISAAGFETLLLKEASSADPNYPLGHLYKISLQISMAISIAIAALIYAYSASIASVLFGSPQLSVSFKIASISIPAYTLINMNAGVLQGLKQLKKYVSIRYVLHHAGGLLLFLIILLFYTDSHIVILAYTISMYFIAATSYFWVRKEWKYLSLNISELPSNINTSGLLLTASPFMIAALLFFVKGWIDTILIGVFMNETDVGVYNIAVKLTALLGVTLSAVSAVSTPMYSEAYSSGDKQRLKSHVHQSSAIVFYTSFPLFLVLILFPEQILSLFGEEFRTGKTALIILAFGGVINAYFGVAGYFMKMTGCQVVLQRITFVTVIIGLLLNIYLIPIYGIEGAAGATALAICIWNIWCVIYIKKRYNLSVYYVPGFLRSHNVE